MEWGNPTDSEGPCSCSWSPLIWIVLVGNWVIESVQEKERETQKEGKHTTLHKEKWLLTGIQHSIVDFSRIFVLVWVYSEGVTPPRRILVVCLKSSKFDCNTFYYKRSVPGCHCWSECSLTVWSPNSALWRLQCQFQATIWNSWTTEELRQVCSRSDGCLRWTLMEENVPVGFHHALLWRAAEESVIVYHHYVLGETSREWERCLWLSLTHTHVWA